MSSMLVRVPNALTQNTVVGRPFPVSVTCESRDGISSTWLCPIQAVDLVDLFVTGAGPYAFLCDVGVADYEQDEEGAWREVPLSAALPAGVTSLAEDSETLLLPTAHLADVVARLVTYNLTVIDVSEPALDLASLWCALHEHETEEVPTLLAAEQSTRLLRSHDDCYAHLETRDPTLARLAVARLLAITAGTLRMCAESQIGGSLGPSSEASPEADEDAVLARSPRLSARVLGQGPGAAVLDVPDPAPAVVDAALGETGSLTLAQELVQVSGEEVVLPFAQSSWRLADPVPEPTHELVYQGGVGSWQVHGR